MPSYYQHLVSPYDNREVKQIENNDNVDNIDSNKNNNLINSANSQERKSEKIIINTLGFNSQRIYNENENSNETNVSKLDVNNITNMSVYDFTPSKIEDTQDSNNILLPIENKQVNNIVEVKDQSNTTMKNDFDNVYKESHSIDNILLNEDLYKIHNRTDSIINYEKEILKMPLMDLPSSTSSQQSLQLQNSQSSQKNITFPSVN